jgi:hypothetical protein
MRMFGSLIIGFSTGFFSGFWVYCPETSPLKQKWRKKISEINFEKSWFAAEHAVMKDINDDDSCRRDIH